jgi:hypothetical protein
MRSRFHSSDGVEMAITNFALTFAKALLVFCVVLFILINPNKRVEGAKPNAQFLITVDWSGNGHDDVDTWMRLPNGDRINFKNKESGIAFLERDDLGQDCQVADNTCEEIVSLRGIVPGEYVIALHLYSSHSISKDGPTDPVAVHVKIEKLNPAAMTVWQATTTLYRIRQEKGVIRFTVHGDGGINDFNSDALPHLVYGR